MEEKTVATTTTHNLNRQEQRVVTQEVKTTATVTSGEQVNSKRRFVQLNINDNFLSYNFFVINFNHTYLPTEQNVFFHFLVNVF